MLERGKLTTFNHCYFSTSGTRRRVKEGGEIAMSTRDIFACLDGFSLVLGDKGDIIYVSRNMSRYMGVKQVELMGQTMSDYIHPLDLPDLASLTSPLGKGEVRRAEVAVRMKCTITERGRVVNLSQVRPRLI